jgi:DNA-binding NarL/FixJ family response regulator
MVNIVLIDDHRLLVDGLRGMIETEADLQVVGEASDAQSAYEVVEQKKPDVVVLDIGLPGVSGISIARELLRRDPARRILMLSMYKDAEHVGQAMAARVKGYALKMQPAGEILSAIRAVADGRTYLAPEVAPYGVVDPHARRSNGPLGSLSPREREIFQMLVHGHTNESVAANCCISVKTVETHRAHILKKLGAHSIVDLVLLAARHDLLAAE